MIALSNQTVLCAGPQLDRVRWKREGRFDDAVPVLAHGSIYLGTFAEGLWCLEADSGRCRWLFATEARVRAAPAVGKGRVFFGDSGGRFGCLDAQTGELFWTLKEGVAEGVGCAAVPVMAGPLVYVLCHDGVLACLDVFGGGEVWRGSVSRLPVDGASLAVTAHAVYFTTTHGSFGCVGDVGLAERKRELGATSQRQRPPANEVRAGDCCELCRKNYSGNHGWGEECSGGCTSALPNDAPYSISARYCHSCINTKLMRHQCPRCGAPLLDSIL